MGGNEMMQLPVMLTNRDLLALQMDAGRDYGVVELCERSGLTLSQTINALEKAVVRRMFVRRRLVHHRDRFGPWRYSLPETP